MYEMTAAELDAELAIELPDRALMSRAKKAKVSISHSVIVVANQQNFLWQQANANGGNVDIQKAHDFSAGNGGNAQNFAWQVNSIDVQNGN